MLVFVCSLHSCLSCACAWEQDWQRVSSPLLRLQNMTQGFHSVRVRAENQVGSVSLFSSELSFYTPRFASKSACAAVGHQTLNSTVGGVGGAVSTSSILRVRDREISQQSNASVFVLEGSSSRRFDWRVDSGPWQRAIDSPRLSVELNTSGWHILEYLPLAQVICFAPFLSSDVHCRVHWAHFVARKPWLLLGKLAPACLQDAS